MTIFAMLSGWELGILGALPLLFLLMYSARNRNAPLVIKTWRADETPNSKGHYIVIEGRPHGITSWLLSLLRVDPITSITVSDKRIEFEVASLSGRTKRLIPLPSICSTDYGYKKPWLEALLILLLILGLFLALKGGLLTILLGLLLSFGLAFLYYFLNRQFTLGFVENSGVISSIQFKRSVIENQDINEDQASYVCEITQALIEHSRNKT